MTVITPGLSATPILAAQIANPSGAVAILTSATTIVSGVVNALSYATVDTQVVFGMLTLNNTAASATSVTISVNAGTGLTQLNGFTPNVWLGATGTAGATATFAVVAYGSNVQSGTSFTVALSALASAANINAYMGGVGNNYTNVYLLAPGTL